MMRGRRLDNYSILCSILSLNDWQCISAAALCEHGGASAAAKVHRAKAGYQ